MATSPEKPPAAPPGPVDPYEAHDPIPQPDVVEGDSDTKWELWSQVRDKEHGRYADTVPVTVPGAQSPLARPQAQPPGAPLRPAQPAGRSGLDQLLDECKRNNRVCPNPAAWLRLDTLMRAKSPKAAAILPPPLPQAQWALTTALAKRSMFRGVAEWAAAHSLTEDMLQFVRALPERQWHHLGE